MEHNDSARVSSWLKKMEIEATTDVDHSVIESVIDYEDSKVESEQLNLRTKQRGKNKGIEETKKNNKQLTADKQASKAYRNVQTFLKRMSLKQTKGLSNRAKTLIKANGKIVAK